MPMLPALVGGILTGLGATGIGGAIAGLGVWSSTAFVAGWSIGASAVGSFEYKGEIDVCSSR